MAIGITEDHRALGAAVRGLLERELGEVAPDRAPGSPAGWWKSLAEQGLIGPHLSEQAGGGGGTLLDLAVVMEQTGRALLPGNHLPTVLATVILDRGGRSGPETASLADGSRSAAVALDPGGLRAEPVAGGRLRLHGSTPVVLGDEGADLLLLPARSAEGEGEGEGAREGGGEGAREGGGGGAREGEGEYWYLVEATEAGLTPLPSLDLTRGLLRVELDVVLPAERRVVADTPALRAALAVPIAAEACGIAAWALDTAVRHATLRHQFGRPIGQFQAVKHLCAHLLVRTEKATAAVWQAARDQDALARDAVDQAAVDQAAVAREAVDRGAVGRAEVSAAVAVALALEAAYENAKDCIQILGGIGFTWEHGAHLRLRRAAVLRQLLGGVGSGGDDGVGGGVGCGERALFGAVGRAAVAHGLARPALELPPEAEHFRTEARAAAASVAGLDPAEQRRRLAPDGWAAPHLPVPYGRGAGPLQQLAVDQELAAAGVRLPDLTIGTWVVPSLVAHGTPEQRERYLMPTLRGELSWCQLFSEPEAGSDLASLRTRAVRLPDGRWRVDGQKVWTSSARTADFGILLARTAPEKPKHQGLTYFLVDMRTTRGIDIRPLREITGDAVFNEVFLDGVELPADAVVGEVDGGWRVARHTLGNERVHMADASPTLDAVRQLLAVPGADPATLGRLAADEHVLGCIDLRTALSSLDGLDPGAGGSIRKLVSAPHAQRVAESALELSGPEGAVQEGAGARIGHAFLMSRCLTIAGGTTQVQLNVVAERILGLPRDPEPTARN